MATVDIVQGIDFGVGIDSLSGQVRGDAVIRTDSQDTLGASGQKVLINVKLVESQEDLNSALNISAEVSASFAVFGGSDKFTFAEKCQFHQFSLFLVIHVSVVNAFKQMRDVQLKPQALDLLSTGQALRFHEEFGDMFVRGVQTGGEFAAVLEIQTTSTNDAQDVKNHLEARGLFGVLSGESDYSQSVQQATKNHGVAASLFQQGGDQKASIKPDEIINHALTFAREVDGPRSVAFSAFLQDYKTLDLPPLNFVNLENQKEMLEITLSKRRAALTTLNSVNYVIQHPDQFEPPIPPNLDLAAKQLTDFIDTMTHAASRCVNNVQDCPIPPDEPPPITLPKRKAGPSLDQDPLPVPDPGTIQIVAEMRKLADYKFPFFGA